MLTETQPAQSELFLAPPSTLLSPITDPTTGQPSYAFPLQTTAWLKMQNVVRIALGFPLSEVQFTNLYGTFSAEATIDEALAVLGTIQKTAAEYGDPTTLITQLPAFQQASTAPDSIYGSAVWLAAQTQLAAQQIAALLQEGLDDIGTNPDPQTRINELTALLTGDGGITSLSTTLNGQISAFQTKTSTFYTTLNTEIGNPQAPNSLEWYIGQDNNVLDLAKQAVKDDQTAIDDMQSTIKQLNDEYIGFTVAASVSPVFLLIPFVGIFIAVADATTFAILAAKVKEKLDQVKSQLEGEEAEQQKKNALVTQLGGFNTSVADVDTDGKAFLDAIGQMISGWTEFEGQINLRLKSLTTQDVEDWGAFMTKIGFKTSLDGWNLIGSKAELFFQAGFVQFSTQSSS